MYLGPFQKAGAIRTVQNNPNATGSIVIQNMANVEDQQAQINHSLKGSVDRLVRSERVVVLSKGLGGVKVAGNEQDKVKKLI